MDGHGTRVPSRRRRFRDWLTGVAFDYSARHAGPRCHQPPRRWVTTFLFWLPRRLDALDRHGSHGGDVGWFLARGWRHAPGDRHACDNRPCGDEPCPLDDCAHPQHHDNCCLDLNCAHLHDPAHAPTDDHTHGTHIYFRRHHHDDAGV